MEAVSLWRYYQVVSKERIRRMMLDFADERITNSVDKGKRVKDCCNLVSSTTAEASWKTRKRWIQNISMESLSYSNRQI